jgi:hypothetical protein
LPVEGINTAGSYGSSANVTAAEGQYKLGQLGFVANYNKYPGWKAPATQPSTPGYGGDYFIPGYPLEGTVCLLLLLQRPLISCLFNCIAAHFVFFDCLADDNNVIAYLTGLIVQYSIGEGDNEVTRYFMNQGLMGPWYAEGFPNITIPPPISTESVSVTSSGDVLSSLWAGSAAEIEMTSVTSLRVDGLFYTTTTTIKNTGNVPIKNLGCKLMNSFRYIDATEVIYIFLETKRSPLN